MPTTPETDTGWAHWVEFHEDPDDLACEAQGCNLQAVYRIFILPCQCDSVVCDKHGRMWETREIAEEIHSVFSENPPFCTFCGENSTGFGIKPISRR